MPIYQRCASNYCYSVAFLSYVMNWSFCVVFDAAVWHRLV